MGKPKAPKPADPKVTGAAQTATNIGTAIAQQNLNNVNQVTPYGDLTYEQTGSYTYTDPLDGKKHTIPTYTATQSLSKDQQDILNSTNEAQKNFADLAANQSRRIDKLLSRPVDVNGLPKAGDPNKLQAPNFRNVGTGPNLQETIANAGSIERGFGSAGDITKTYGTDFADQRQEVEDALMDRMNPRLEQDRNRLESRLASQGIRIGSAAYNAAMDDFSRQTNDARLGAIINAGQEQSRLAGLEAQRATFENSAQQQNFSQLAQRAAFANQAQQQQFGQNSARAGFLNQARNQEFQNRMQGTAADNQAEQQQYNAELSKLNAQNAARQQALQETFAVRNQPINEITALMSGSQVQNPNFITPNVAQMPTTDFAGIQANYDNAMQQRYQQQMSNWNNLVGGALSFGSNLLLSDERTKKDVKQVGKTNDGQNIYQFRYKSGGPIQMGMMAQEVEKKKPKAVADVGGIKMVDYGKALKGARS